MGIHCIGFDASMFHDDDGRKYVVVLESVPELCCTLGRETAIQRMKWTDDGWLRMENGGNMAEASVEESSLPEVPIGEDAGI